MMKNIFFVSVLFTFLVACGGSESNLDPEMNDLPDVVNEDEVVEEVVNSFIIESKSVGLFTVGEEVPVLPEVLKMRQFLEKDESGEELKHNVIFNQIEDVVELIMHHDVDDVYHEDKNIEEMIVLSDYYETSEGIAIGTTVEHLLDVYTDAQLIYLSKEDRYIIETEKYEDVQFVLNSEDCNKKPKGKLDREVVDFHDFNFGAKIKEIVVF